MTEIEVLRQTLRKNGVSEQLTVAIEECAELIQAISKIKRYGKEPELIYNLTEEIADVQIIINELLLIFGCKVKVTAWKKYKLERMEKRLEETENE